MPAEGIELCESGNILRYEEFLRIARISVAHGVTSIRVTGGEPLVRKGIVEFIRTLASIPGLDDLSITKRRPPQGLRCKTQGSRAYKVNVSSICLDAKGF